MIKHSFVLLITVAAVAMLCTTVSAETPLERPMAAHVDGLLSDARASEPGLAGFSAEAGKRLFNSTRPHSSDGKQRGCTSCHTDDPAATGKTQVGKPIDPISPAANQERFTDPGKVEKWFKRNCKWVLERECTPREKGDFITFMMSL